jgi:pimeloyl-ACP methyl ester carboxylesterase
VLPGFCCIAVDLPGMAAQTDGLHGVPLRPRCPAMLGSLLDRLGLEAVRLVGHSLGG